MALAALGPVLAAAAPQIAAAAAPAVVSRLMQRRQQQEEEKPQSVEDQAMDEDLAAQGVDPRESRQAQNRRDVLAAAATAAIPAATMLLNKKA